jgi:TIGR03009 family protein
MLKPVLAGLAISSLCLAFAAEACAQNGAKKKPAIKRVEAEVDDDEPPRANSRTRQEADDNEDVAEPAPRRRAGGRQPRPEALPLRIEKLNPELEQVLKDWEFHTSRFKTMAGSFTRFKYDRTFEVEKRAEGKFVYEAPDKGNYELRGVKIQKGDVSKKKNKNGDPWELKSDEGERWVCNGKKVIRINDKEKTYEEVPIPPDSQGQNIIDGPLPFLFGMKAEKAKLRYKLELKERDESEIRLDVFPRLPGDAANWVKASVIIEAKTFKPRAVKLLDPTGAESVHVFRDIVINERRGFFDRDPFRPSLRNYKLVLNDKPADEKPIPPATKQAKGTNGKTRATANDTSGLDLGRTADAGSDIPARKKSTAPNR